MNAKKIKKLSKNSSQKKISKTSIKKKNDKNNVHSPRTIDYSKVMEKYSDYIENNKNNNLDIIDKNINNKKKNKSFIIQNKENELNNLNDIQNKNSPKENNSNKLKINNKLKENKTKLKKLKKDNDYLKENLNNENRNNNSFSNNNNYNEKFYIFIKLFRNYAKKFNKLIPLLSFDLNNNKNNDIFSELKQTIEQFNNVVFNDKLNKIFSIEEENKKNYCLFEIDQFEPTSINFYKNFENKISILEN